MSLHPTSREAATGGVNPFDLVAATDHGAMMQGAQVIDSAPGDPGAVTVRRTPGNVRYDEKLTDAVAVYDSKSPGVTVRVIRGDR